jgi:hypothetical protein
MTEEDSLNWEASSDDNNDYDSERESPEFDGPLEKDHKPLEPTFRRANLISLYPKRAWRQRAW